MPGNQPTQADKRRNMRLKDQHGREWFAVIEKASGAPTGLVQAMFAVPHPALIPPQKYLVFPPDEPNQVRINYREWAAELEHRELEWQAERRRVMSIIPGGAQNPVLVDLMGPQPMSPAPVKAMEQGNRWALGFTDIKPPEAEAFFPREPTPEESIVFSETDPFTPPATVAEGQAPVASGPSMNEILADVARRCPKHLVGIAKKSWCLDELNRLATETAGA